jgi:hypothetical protein
LIAEGKATRVPAGAIAMLAWKLLGSHQLPHPTHKAEDG